MAPETQLHSRQLGTLAGELIEAMPPLDPAEQRVAFAVYRLLALGEPVPPSRIAERVGVPADRVAVLLDSWPGVYRDSEGRMIGFWGLALSEMPHRVQVDGRTLYGWCAWDTLFIPLILGKEARVESPCATTGEVVSLTVGPDGIRDVAPEGAVLSFLRPEGKFDYDVILSFCHYVLLFRSEEAGGEWTAAHANTFLLSPAEGFELGRLTWETKLAAALRDDPARAA
jgi:alkylmercury lyase